MNVVDFTYVHNVVHAHLLAAERMVRRASRPSLPPRASERASARAAQVPESPACGRCYFITNGERRRFWDFVGTVLSGTGCVGPTKRISPRVAAVFASGLEWLSWLLKPVRTVSRFIAPDAAQVVRIRPSLTRHMVWAMTAHHWFSHARATRDLGYTPLVSLDEGLQETIVYFQQVNVRAASPAQVLIEHVRGRSWYGAKRTARAWPEPSQAAWRTSFCD
jgi:nucleoside-diphosphate-sugar epimerase